MDVNFASGATVGGSGTGLTGLGIGDQMPERRQ
jgi:hypothetical protein